MLDINSIPWNENAFINIDAKITDRLTANQLESILFLYGDKVLSYTIPVYMHELMQRHIPFLVKNCTKLECLQFSQCAISYKLRYEVLFKLPNLRHLMLLIKGTLRNDALPELIKLKLETLKIRGSTLSVTQLKQICLIDSLKQLEVSCHGVPLCDLLRLKQLQHLQVTLTFLNNAKLLELIQRLPQLCSLAVRNGVLITQEFVIQAHAWIMTQIGQQRPNKLKIFLHSTSINWQEIDQTVTRRDLVRLEILEITEPGFPYN